VIVDETLEDNIYAIRQAKAAAKALNDETPGSDAIHWRDILPLVLPASTTLSLQDPTAMEAVAAKPATGEPGTGTEGEAAKPTGEFADISTQQWTRNRKAIQKVLDELTAGQTSEAAARVFLGGVGLTEQSIDVLVADALDGSGKLETLDGQV
jgi:hypothetical protein